MYKMNIKNIKLVTLDATNTLLKFRVPPWQYYASVAREYGFIGDGEEIKKPLLDSFKEMWKVHPNFGKDTILWKEWWTNVVKLTFQGRLPIGADVNCIANKLICDFKSSKCWCTADGGSELVGLLKSRDISIGVISNFDPRLKNVLKDVSIYNNFDFILTSYETGFSKPDRRIFDCAIERHGKVQPPQCLHIGDDEEKDYHGAQQAGWHALLLSNKSSEESSPNQKHVFKTLKELSLAIKENKL